jgi:hypothetical protein
MQHRDMKGRYDNHVEVDQAFMDRIYDASLDRKVPLCKMDEMVGRSVGYIGGVFARFHNYGAARIHREPHDKLVAWLEQIPDS